MRKTPRDPQLELSHLESEHRTLKQRVSYLERRALLTPREQHEAADLKKRKLATKDAMAELRALMN